MNKTLASVFVMVLPVLGLWNRISIASSVTGVQLTTVQSTPQHVNDPITLLANSIGGSNVEYRFFVSNSNGWTSLQPYSSNAICSWTPEATGDYMLLVWVREVGSASQRDAYATIPFSIAPPLNAVKLIATPAASAVNRPVTLMAKPDGGAQLEYQFFVYENGDYTVIRPYERNPIHTWTPTATGIYKLLVWAREVGHTAPWESFYKIIDYEVRPAISSVNLFAIPTSANAPIHLIAVPNGGGAVEYRFFVSLNDSVYTQLRRYALQYAFDFTPVNAGKYTFLVWAREVGNTSTKDAYAVATVHIAPPLTGVALTAQPSSPLLVGTMLTLNATPTGGNRVEYRFFVSINGSAYAQLRPYASEPIFYYALPASGSYTFLAWAREVGHTSTKDAYATLRVTAQ